MFSSIERGDEPVQFEPAPSGARLPTVTTFAASSREAIVSVCGALGAALVGAFLARTVLSAARRVETGSSTIAKLRHAT